MSSLGSQMPPEAVACRWSWDICGMARTSVAYIWPGPGATSSIPQGCVYPSVGDVVAVVEALGVDAEQDFDAVPGPLGDAGRGHARSQPERYRCVAQVVGAASEGRGDLG